MTSIRLNPLDSAWLFTESRAALNHVGGLLQFKLPEGAPRDYMRQLMAEFRNHREFTVPWNRRLKYAFNKNPVPVWIEDRNIDLEYHVRHAALPWPGGERELGELVGRLQSTPLDLSRPPWECTIIEGLEGERFALFIKMHHSLIDGVSGMKLLQRAMSTDRKRSLGLPPFWASGTAPASRAAGPMDGAVVLPPLPGPAGNRESPISTRTRSAPRPSSSATSTAITVLVPVPMSCTPLRTTTLPSRPRTRSTRHDPPPALPQTPAAQPTPRFTGPGSDPGTLRRCSAQPIRFAPSGHSSRRIGCLSFSRRTSRGSSPAACANSSTSPSSAKNPCGCPGARNARPTAVKVETPNCTTCWAGMSYARVFAAPAPPVPLPGVP